MKRNIRVIVDSEFLDPSYNSLFIDSSKLELVLESHKKKRKLYEIKTFNHQLDLLHDFVLTPFVAFLKHGRLHKIYESYPCHCPRNLNCNEYESEISISIAGYSDSIERLYSFSITISQEIKYLLGSNISFDEPKQEETKFKWIPNIKIHKYPNIVEIIKNHFKYIKEKLNNQYEFTEIASILLDSIRLNIVQQCKEQETLCITQVNNNNCKICNLAAKFNQSVTKFLEKMD